MRERGVIVRVEMIDPRHQGTSQDIYEVGWVRRYMLTRMTTQDPSVRTLKASHTCPLEDQLSRCLVSTQRIHI